MRIPNKLASLVEEGLIEEVVRPLLSGKEAEVFLVTAGGELRVAKVYKEAHDRTFKNRAAYTEGRKVRNSRDQRAVDKRSRYGRSQDEASWRSTEVDTIYRLHAASVRVPTPYNFIDGVLVMEMIADAEGNPAPRLAEVSLDRNQAGLVFDRLLDEVVRMLCAGIVHGDLSDFNVLMAADGPVVIDFPQSVDAAGNPNAHKLLLRDVSNLERFLSRHTPGYRPRAFGEEIWDLYSRSMLTPETRLTGHHRSRDRKVDTGAVLDLIGDANYDERKRRERQGVAMRGVPEASRSEGPSRPQPSRHPPQHSGPTPPPQGHRAGPTSPQQGNRAGARPSQQGNRGGPRQHGRGHQPSHAVGPRSPEGPAASPPRTEPADPESGRRDAASSSPSRSSTVALYLAEVADEHADPRPKSRGAFENKARQAENNRSERYF